jgi:hypothetical protein
MTNTMKIALLGGLVALALVILGIAVVRSLSAGGNGGQTGPVQQMKPRAREHRAR